MTRSYTFAELHIMRQALKVVWPQPITFYGPRQPDTTDAQLRVCVDCGVDPQELAEAADKKEQEMQKRRDMLAAAERIAFNKAPKKSWWGEIFA